MVKSIYINNRLCYVQDGVAVKELATEELDSCTFQLLNVEELALEPMQRVMVEFVDETRKYFVINTWVEEVATFDTNLKNYIINCISETKKLERCVMPNTAITQPLNIDEAQKRKYNIYLERAKEQYITPIYNNITISDDLIENTSSLVAVEEQFTQPNVKEYLNSILSKFGWIVKLENNVIGYLDLTQKNNAINESKLFFKNTSQNIEDYYSDIYTDVQNAQTETLVTEYVSPRAENSPFLTTDNLEVEVSHNINSIKRVEVYSATEFEDSYGSPRATSVVLYGDSLSKKDGSHLFWDRVVEKSIYDSLKASVAGWTNNGEGRDYKIGNIYFTRGTNKLGGISYRESNFISSLIGDQTTIQNVMREILNVEYEVPTTFRGDIRKLVFVVTYTTLDDVSVNVNKPKNTKSVIRDNQTDSIVDLDKFLKVQQEKLNRLGNETLEIAARYDSLNDVPQLMDYIDDYILAEKEVVYHKDYIDFKGVLYKDYVKRNIYYGVNAKIRNTQLLPVNEAVVRKEFKKRTYNFSFDNTNSNKMSESYFMASINGIARTGVSELETYMKQMISTFMTTFSDGSVKYFRLAPSLYNAGTSIFLNYKFTDNINAGARIGHQEIGGYEQQYIPYTDNNGEFTALYLYLFKDLADDKSTWDYEWTKEFPLYPTSYIDFNKNVVIEQMMKNKDNREIPNITLQFEFTSDDDIFINPRLMEIIQPIGIPSNDEGNKKTYYVWASTTEKYNKYNKDKVVASAVKTDKNLDLTGIVQYCRNNVLFNTIKLYNINEDFNDVVSWALANEDGEICIAVNKRQTDAVIPTTIYLNNKEE